MVQVNPPTFVKNGEQLLTQILWFHRVLLARTNLHII